MTRRDLIIRCPKCGAQYLPSEIFYPKYFFGNPKEIYKDEKGEILGFNGTEMNTAETYTCDKCGETFLTEAVISFKVSQSIDLFDDDPDFAFVDEKK